MKLRSAHFSFSANVGILTDFNSKHQKFIISEYPNKEKVDGSNSESGKNTVRFIFTFLSCGFSPAAKYIHPKGNEVH